MGGAGVLSIIKKGSRGALSMHIKASASLRKILRIAPWVALGPFTGLLGWRMERSLQAKNRLLAVLYGVAIVSTSAMLVSGFGQSLGAWLK